MGLTRTYCRQSPDVITRGLADEASEWDAIRKHWLDGTVRQYMAQHVTLSDATVCFDTDLHAQAEEEAAPRDDSAPLVVPSCQLLRKGRFVIIVVAVVGLFVGISGVVQLLDATGLKD